MVSFAQSEGNENLYFPRAARRGEQRGADKTYHRSQVTAPRMQKHVFCRVRAKDLGQVDFNSTPGAPAQPVQLNESDIFVTRYDKVAPFVRADKISLI